MKRWEKLCEEFIAEYAIRGIAQSTIKNREREFYKFGYWLKKRKPQPKLEEITIEIIHEYIKSRTTFISKSSTCAVIGSLRLIGDHLTERGYWLQNPLRWITGPKLNNMRKIPKTYHRSDLHKIFEESFHSHIVFARTLYPAIISLFYSSGIRKSELLELNTDCWNSEESTIKVFSSKTGRERIIPVPNITRKCIESYVVKRNNLLIRKNKRTDALFVNNNGERVNGTQVLVQFKRIAKRAGVQKATIHMFRHSCATGLIEEGVPLPQVQRILGHACTQTTFRYLDIANPERKKAISKHPITTILQNLKELENERV